MTRTRSLALALATALTIAVASPAMAGDVAAPQSPAGSWERTTTSGVAQTLTFDAKEGRVYGKSGCNNFTGGYTSTGTKLEIGPLASTMMMCGDAEMAAERAFLTKLQAATKFAVTVDDSNGDLLKLTGPEGTMRFRAAE